MWACWWVSDRHDTVGAPPTCSICSSILWGRQISDRSCHTMTSPRWPRRGTSTQRQRVQDRLAICRARTEALARCQREDEHSMPDRLNVPDRPDVEQQRAFDASEPKWPQDGIQAFDRIPGDVFETADVKRHIVVRGLDVIHSVRVERIQPMLPFSDEHNRGSCITCRGQLSECGVPAYLRGLTQRGLRPSLRANESGRERGGRKRSGQTLCSACFERPRDVLLISRDEHHGVAAALGQLTK
jgi:hypothetical protein